MIFLGYRVAFSKAAIKLRNAIPGVRTIGRAVAKGYKAVRGVTKGIAQSIRQGLVKALPNYSKSGLAIAYNKAGFRGVIQFARTRVIAPMLKSGYNMGRVFVARNVIGAGIRKTGFYGWVKKKYENSKYLVNSIYLPPT